MVNTIYWLLAFVFVIFLLNFSNIITVNWIKFEYQYYGAIAFLLYAIALNFYVILAMGLKVIDQFVRLVEAIAAACVLWLQHYVLNSSRVCRDSLDPPGGGCEHIVYFYELKIEYDSFLIIFWASVCLFITISALRRFEEAKNLKLNVSEETNDRHKDA